MSGSKLGKGGGRGTGRMVVTPPPPLGRGMAMPMRRQVMGPKQKGTGMGKGRLGSAGGSGLAFVAPSQEESFQVLSLDQGRAPFAMAIRLTPEVLEDLKRAEAEDVKCEMKFGITPTGHVIKVGSEEYKFSSAPEPGDLCDIYEEQQHGEGGNGVLKEAGSVWRKLSVLRILNASEKDRVKNRSKEAERQQKSRKAIILDPTHSLVKNQGGASGDVNGRRVPVKPKKEPPKKMQKPPISSPVVSVTKPKPVMTTASLLGAARVAKAASVTSPELPPLIQPQTAIILPPKGQPVVEERDSIPAPMKASTLVQNINTPSPVTTASDTAVVTKAGGVISPIELRNSLITLLTDNPKGLTIKAVEKALGESMPHVKPERKTIEKAIKVIASYHAPGKYMLREGVSFAKPSPGGGSSPEIPAAETPPLVDSPANAELAPDAVPEPLKERIAPGELGLLGERPGAPLGAGPGRLSSFTMQRCSGDRVSRAIRKADEKLRVNAERSQQSIVESMISHNPESVSLKEPLPYSHDAELISIRVDESPEQDMMDTEGTPLGKSKQGEELAMDSPEGEEKMANSGGSDSSSSSDSGSDTDSDSHSGSESHSGTSRSGSGSDSDSDGSSSSGNDDENMDEDVEIVSEDEENGTPLSEDSPHLKPKTKDKKQVSRQAKEKQLKFKVSDKIPISRDSGEVDIVGDDAVGHIGTDSAEKAIVAVEVLDNNMEVDVDVLSVDGGIGSPQEWGSLSPPGLQRQQESLKGIGGSEDAKSKVKLVPIIDKSSADSDQSLGAVVTKQNNVQGLEKKKDDIESSKQLVKGGETQRADMDSRFAKSVEKDKDKAANLRGRGGIEIHNNRLAAAKESPVHNASPFRSDMPSKSSLESPAVNNDVVETSCQPGKESMAKRHANPEFLKTFPKDAGAAVKTVVDWETDELGERTLSEKAVADKNVGEKIVGVLNKPLQRPGKGREKPNPLSKQPVEMPQRNVASRNTDVSSTILREAEPVAVAGRKTDAAAFTQSSKEPESTKGVPRDLNLQNNPDAGLLGRPGKDLGNRQLKRDMDSQGTNSYKEPGLVVRPGRDPKQARRQSLEPAVPQQNESLKKTDVQGKPMKDMDMAARTCNDGLAQNSSFRDGRKKETITQEPAKGMLNINNNDGVSKHNEKRATESSDLEVGELQESTQDVKTSDQTRKDGTQVEAAKGWEIVEQATSNKPLVHKGQVSPPKDKAQGTGKAAGDFRKASPITAETWKPILLTHKEVQRVDQVAARETGRTTTGILKPGNILQEERLDAVSALKSRVSLSVSAERPQEFRGLKRLAEDGDNQEPAARVNKKPSVTPVPPQLPVNCSVHSDTAPVSKLEKTSAVQDIAPRPPNAELNRGGPLDVLLNHAAPSSKASSAENGRKQWPYVKGQEDFEKEGFEQQIGQEPDRKPKISASVLAPGNKISALSDSGQSNGKWANLSGSCGGADEMDYFLMYEKNAPELRGPAVTYEQAEKYKREYEEKYIIYRRLYDDIEDTRLDFATFKREIERASNAPEKLQQVRSKIQMTYHAVRKRSKRMQKTFNVLHDELLTIKQHLKDFAEKAGQG